MWNFFAAMGMIVTALIVLILIAAIYYFLDECVFRVKKLKFNYDGKTYTLYYVYNGGYYESWPNGKPKGLSICYLIWDKSNRWKTKDFSNFMHLEIRNGTKNENEDLFLQNVEINFAHLPSNAGKNLRYLLSNNNGKIHINHLAFQKSRSQQILKSLAQELWQKDAAEIQKLIGRKK